jgi:hypothetical protein
LPEPIGENLMEYLKNVLKWFDNWKKVVMFL